MARVLIIEDEPTITMVLQETLTDEGHDVETVPDGLAGLKRLGQGPIPDIVLMDLFMPHVSGRAVVEAMRADPQLRGIPVILITGAVLRAEDYPPEGSYQALIGKPFSVADVVYKVQTCLEAGGRSSG